MEPAPNRVLGRRNHGRDVSPGAWGVRIVAAVQKPPWDPEKARENFVKHGIGFEEAREAALDELSRARPDPGHSADEDRWIVIGTSRRGRLLFVVVATDAEGKMRIISARRATKRERHAFEDL